jgi:hypothetical protein
MSFHRSAPLATTCALGVSLLLAACGGSTPKLAASQENEEKLVNFAKCMREHGVNVTTSTGSAGGSLLQVHGGNPHALEVAQSACKRYQPTARKENITPQEKVARQEAVLKFAKCMREHGVDIHASTQGAGIQVGIQGGPGSSGPKPDSPAFQAAQKACQGLLPGGGPGPGATTNKVNPKGGSGAGFAIGG